MGTTRTEACKNDRVVFHEKNVEYPKATLELVQQFFDELNEEVSEERVRAAMILKIEDPNTGVEYSLKSGGGSSSDHLYESVLKVEGSAIMKKYSTEFAKVKIGPEEICDNLRPMFSEEEEDERVDDRCHLLGLVAIAHARDTIYGTSHVERKFGKEASRDIRHTFSRILDEGPVSGKEVKRRTVERLKKAVDRDLGDTSFDLRVRANMKIMDREEAERAAEKQVHSNCRAARTKMRAHRIVKQLEPKTA